jgi:glycosyltransferase involved in cell wall biosynthesis
VRLGVSGWRIHGQRTGVGRVVVNVLKHWTAEVVAERFQEITIYTPKTIDRRDIPLPENLHVRVLNSTWPMLVWENLRMAPAANDDVMFCPSFSRPVFARGKTVVVIYEAVLHMYPELFPFPARIFYDRLYRWSARRATLVISASEAARQDVARCYQVPSERIRVVHLAPAEHFSPLPTGDPRITQARERYVESSAPFFLFVGKMSGRRNIPLLLEGFAEFKRRTGHPHKLLIVGPDSSALNVAALSAQLGLADHVVRCPYVPDEELNSLYNAAEAYVSPSVYEPVSLPILEAQTVGTPVIGTDSPGTQEITGGAALLIRRLEVRELAEAMTRLAGDAALRRELGEKGRVNAQRFSWQRCATEILAILVEAGQSPAPSPL